MASHDVIHEYNLISRQISVLSKMFKIKVFQYKISDRMRYLTALYDNFEIFQKKIFNEEEFLKIEGQFAKFQPIFNQKTVLNSKHIGESIFEQSGRARCKSVPHPLPSQIKINFTKSKRKYKN